MTDEPREIAPCPMPGCGKKCHVNVGGGWAWVACNSCRYECRWCLTESQAIAAHNALCADAQRGREAARLRAKYDTLSAERKEQFVVDMAELLSGRDEGYVAWLEDQNEAIEQERDALSLEVERLSAALTALHLESDHEAEYLRAEVERLRAIEAAASDVSENALDMGLYYQARSEDMDALRGALDAGKEDK